MRSYSSEHASYRHHIIKTVSLTLTYICASHAQNTKGVGSATTIAQILKLHNSLRATYRAPALKWNTTLAASAQVRR